MRFPRATRPSSAITSRYLDHIAPADVIALGRSRTWSADE
jgi:hypothetical protein